MITLLMEKLKLIRATALVLTIANSSSWRRMQGCVLSSNVYLRSWRSDDFRNLQLWIQQRSQHVWWFHWLRNIHEVHRKIMPIPINRHNSVLPLSIGWIISISVKSLWFWDLFAEKNSWKHPSTSKVNHHFHRSWAHYLKTINASWLICKGNNKPYKFYLLELKTVEQEWYITASSCCKSEKQAVMETRSGLDMSKTNNSTRF